MICVTHGTSIAQSLAALELEKQAAEHESATTGIDLHFEVQRRHRHEVERALETAREEAEEAGFWSDVGDAAKVTAAAAGVVAAAATGGSSLVVTLAVLGAAGTTATQTSLGRGFLRERGMSDDAIKWTGLASAALSMGAGAAASGCASAGVLENACTMTAGAAGVVGGAAYFGEKSADSRQTLAMRDAAQAERGTAEADEKIDEEISALKRSAARHTANMKQIVSIQTNANETLRWLLGKG